MRAELAPRLRLAAAMGLAVLACSPFRPAGRAFDYAAPPPPSDPYSARVAFWQVRQRAEATGSGVAAQGPETAGSLGERYDAFVSSERHDLVRRVVAWAQATARAQYARDPADYWPTFDELRRSRREDCDGLELMIYRSLQAFGFDRARLFRAVIEDPEGELHMVTLWFEDSTDPWVLDPTGFATVEPALMSSLESWTPRRVFSEEADYAVLPRALR